MNEALTITGAILAVLTALLFNRKDVSDLRADMKENNAALRADMSNMRTEIKAGIADLRTGMRDGFARVDARFERVDARFERIESRIDKMQSDINVFASVSVLQHQRIATLESAKS